MTDELPIVLLHGSATGSYSWAAVRMGVVQGIDYLERNLRRFMRPTRRHIALDMRFGSNRIEYQPLGVVGIISPWNYPVNLSLMPVVTAIAAGNRVMLKPSKLTPATNAVEGFRTLSHAKGICVSRLPDSFANTNRVEVRCSS
jgi:acyl-CoA reductase-like NAD-dependent aldehyde dehydrogenase